MKKFIAILSLCLIFAVTLRAPTRAYGPPCEPITPDDANRVYGLKGSAQKPDVRQHGDIGVIKACMNQFLGTNFTTTDNNYDQQLADAVTKFQKSQGIWNSGISGRVGKATRCAICKAKYPKNTYPASYNNYCTRASNCGGDPVPTTPTMPSTPTTTPETTTPSTTSVGVQSTSGYALQSNYKNVYWKYAKNDSNKKSSISSSGCSFIATVNALKRLGLVNNLNSYITKLAGWTITQKPKWTAGGWDKIQSILKNYSDLKNKVGYSKLNLANLSTEKKLEKVKSELSKGKAIIFFGKNGAPYTSGGHYVTVVGVTSDNKIVVANSAKGGSLIDYKTFFSHSYSTPRVIYKK